jgi:hypothetical protein
MKVGTKSLLFGAHQFIIHPIFVFIAWWKLYGFPCDPRLLIAFIVHDLGYWGSPNMDGPEGDKHIELGAKICGKLFGHKWHDFCLYHSRFASKRDNNPFSLLCVADKLSIVLEPAWLYLPRVKLSGEIKEYMKLAKDGKYYSMQVRTLVGERQWFDDMQKYLRGWVEEHKDGRDDTWTPKIKESNTDSGVWK